MGEETKLKGDVEKSAQESEKATADANSASSEALAKEAELAQKRADDAVKRGKLAEEQAMHAKAEDTLHVEEKDMSSLEADIAKAAEHLRKYRKDIDASGGVYRSKDPTPAPPCPTCPKSLASTKSVGLAVVAVILA